MFYQPRWSGSTDGILLHKLQTTFEGVLEQIHRNFRSPDVMEFGMMPTVGAVCDRSFFRKVVQLPQERRAGTDRAYNSGSLWFSSNHWNLSLEEPPRRGGRTSPRHPS